MSTRECRSILYVDDDQAICEVVLTTLSLVAGLAVHLADSGERAIDRAFELRPDLILMNEMLPDMDGLTTLRRLRESPLIADIPIIFLTAQMSPTHVAHLIERGAIGVIGKPFDPLRLGDALLALWRSTDVGRGVALNPGDPARRRAHTLSLEERFLDRTLREVARLNDLLARAAAGDRAAFEAVQCIAHSIHGTAAMLGFAAVGSAGGELERLVESAIMATASPVSSAEPATMRHLVKQTGRLALAVEAAAKSLPTA